MIAALKTCATIILAALAAALVASSLGACASLEPCVTDSECAELCEEGTRDLPADHPDYCDGGY